MTTEIQNPNPLVAFKDFSFGFRTTKDKETGTESKRATVEVKLPVPSFEGVVAYLQAGGKESELIFSAIEDVISKSVKDLLSEDETITSDNFPYARVTWEAIANMPPSERKGRGIDKETWEEFIKDYLAVMPGLTSKPMDAIKKQAQMLALKFSPLKSIENARKNNILPGFKAVLTVYMNGSANSEQFTECVEYLIKKADALLATDNEANLENSLGL